MSPGQLAIIVLLLLLVFGASRLGEIGRGLGKSVRAIRKGLDGEPRREPGDGEDEADEARPEKRRKLPRGKPRERGVQNRRHVPERRRKRTDDEDERS